MEIWITTRIGGAFTSFQFLNWDTNEHAAQGSRENQTVYLPVTAVCWRIGAHLLPRSSCVGAQFHLGGYYSAMELGRGLEPRFADYESAALPFELSRHIAAL